MESKTGDIVLEEFSKPLLEKTKQPNIKSAQNNKNDNGRGKRKISDNKGRFVLRSNESTYSIVPISDVTQGAIEVWANLPDEIRQDPSLASFRQEHERIHGELLN